MGIVDGKIAIVTGSGRGVGRGEAMELAAQGAKVVVNDPGGSSKGEGNDNAPGRRDRRHHHGARRRGGRQLRRHLVLGGRREPRAVRRSTRSAASTSS